MSYEKVNTPQNKKKANINSANTLMHKDAECECLAFLDNPTLSGLQSVLSNDFGTIGLFKAGVLLRKAIANLLVDSGDVERMLWLSCLATKIQASLTELYKESFELAIMGMLNYHTLKFKESGMFHLGQLLSLQVELLDAIQLSRQGFRRLLTSLEKLLSLFVCKNIPQKVTHFIGALSRQETRLKMGSLSSMTTALLSGKQKKDEGPTRAAYCVLGIVSCDARTRPQTLQSASEMSSKILKTNWDTSFARVDQFLGVIAGQLEPSSPLQAPAELFVSEFLKKLFELSWETKTPKYTSFVFKVLRTLYGSLENLLENSKDQPSHDRAARAGSSTQFTRLPRAKYAMHIRELCAQLIAEDRLLDSYKLDLFELAREIATFDPEYINRNWFRKLDHQNLPVCAVLNSIALHHWQAVGDHEPLHQTTKRIMCDLGGSRYKSRALDAIAKLVPAQMESSTWTCLLVGVLDKDKTVSTAARSLAATALKDQRSLEALASMFFEHKEDKLSWPHFRFCALVRSLGHAELQKSEPNIRQLNSRLIEADSLAHAYILVRQLKGAYFPQNQLLRGLQEICDMQRPWKVRSVWLNMLCYANLSLAELSAVKAVQITRKLVLLLASGKLAELGAIEAIGCILAKLMRAQVDAEMKAKISGAVKSLLEGALGVLKLSITISPHKIAWLALVCSISRFLQLPSDKVCEITEALRTSILRISANAQALDEQELALEVIAKVSYRTPEAFAAFLETEKVFEFPVKARAVAFLVVQASTELDRAQAASPPKRKKAKKVPQLTASTNASISRDVATYVVGEIPKAMDAVYDFESVQALRIVERALKSRMVTPDDCISRILALTFSRNSEISPMAWRIFRHLCEKHGKEVRLKFVEGLSFVKSPASAPSEQLAVIWRYLSEAWKQRERKQLAERIGEALHTQVDPEFATFLHASVMKVAWSRVEAGVLARQLGEAAVAGHGHNAELLLNLLRQKYDTMKRNLLEV